MRFLLFISGILVLAVCLSSCDGKPTRKPLNTNTKPLVDTRYSFENPPIFKKHGELQFINSSGDSVISTIDIEIASNHNDRALGLMYRPTMEPNQGMLFIFEDETIQSFWMRNTLISLDMLYVNSNREIVTIHKNTPTLTDRSFPSDEPAVFVVEVVGGYCDSIGINPGDKIVF
jgi:uncharacterized protein